MRTPLLTIAAVASVAYLIVTACAIVASPSMSEASSGCPGIPALCGMSCSPDAFGTPIFCSNGQCSCAPGYDTLSGPSGLVCQPIQPPEFIGTEASGDTTTAACGQGSCTF